MDTNAWLALLAIVSVIELAGMIVLAVFVWRKMTEVSSAMELLAQDARPLLHRANQVLDDMQDLAARARRADASFQAAAARVTETWERAKAIARWRVWPGLVLAKGLRAVGTAVRRRRAGDDRDAESRFVYEGGTHASHGR